MTRRLDWERANERLFKAEDARPGEEISENSAREDQESLAKGAARRKKRTKYVRSTPKERNLQRLMETPETAQERRLRTVLAALSGGKSVFQLTAAEDASHRLFQRKDVRLRVKFDPTTRQCIAVSPDEPQSFDWVTVSVAPGALEDRHAADLTMQLRELISKQNQLRQARND